MGELDKKGKPQFSRRDFLKTGAAALGAGTAGFEFAARPSMALAADVAKTYHTTCPYCSASCGQMVDVDASGNVLDVYGDHESPFNDGGLCAKGAGAYQLVTNERRIGAWAGTHPVSSVFEYTSDTGTYPTGVAYRRYANGAWERMDLQSALVEAAGKLVTDRGTLDVSGADQYDSKGVAFFGSSHLNNEQCYVLRKIVANFGTTETEHQARI